MTIDDIFPNLSEFEHAALFEGVDHPWEPLLDLGLYLKAMIQSVGQTARTVDTLPGVRMIPMGQVESGFVVQDWIELKEAVLFADQNILLGAGTRLEPTAIIKGPCLLGKANDIRQGCYLRGNVLTGNHCTLGHATEIKNSILMNHTEAGHFNYIGDSILGNYVNMGAGSKLANLQFRSADEKSQGFINELKIPTESGDLETGLEKLGSVVGDHSELGCNAVLSPGTILGNQVWVYPNFTIPKGFYASRQILAPSELRPRQRPR